MFSIQTQNIDEFRVIARKTGLRIFAGMSDVVISWSSWQTNSREVGPRSSTMANSTTTSLFLGGLATLSSLMPCTAWPDESTKPLVGTWKLTGWTVRVVGETEDKEPFGPNPKGRLVMTPDGYWIVIITGANRHPAMTAEEKVALFDSVLAYSGKYTIEGDKITNRVDMSGNEVFTGRVQTRFFKIDGQQLIVRTPEINSAALP